MTHDLGNGYVISTNPERIQPDAVCEDLSGTYWAAGRPREVVKRSLRESLCFGLYHGDRQVGLARVVTDRATFAWLCDVYVNEDHRGRGLGKRLLEAVVAHPDLAGLHRILLATRDAHGLYERYGFKGLAAPGHWMEVLDADGGTRGSSPGYKPAG
jgi:GNAT superfamily N-acetyltransferase